MRHETKKRIRSCWRNRCLWSSWRLTARNDAIVARDVMHDPWDLNDRSLYAFQRLRNITHSERKGGTYDNS